LEADVKNGARSARVKASSGGTVVGAPTSGQTASASPGVLEMAWHKMSYLPENAEVLALLDQLNA